MPELGAPISGPADEAPSILRPGDLLGNGTVKVGSMQELYLLISGLVSLLTNRLNSKRPVWETITVGLQIAQTRSYLYTLGPKIRILYILGAPG